MTSARRPSQYDTGRAGARPLYDKEALDASCPPRVLVDVLAVEWRPLPNGGALIRCPEHDDRHPSCRLAPAPNGGTLAHCPVCNIGWDHYGLFGAFHGLRDFRDQLEALAARVGISPSTAGPTHRDPLPRRPRRQHIGVRIDQEAERWLRGLDVKFTAEEADEIGAMREGDIKSLMGALTAADLERREQQDQRDDELERLADAFDEHDRRRTAAYLEGKWPTPQRRSNGT